MLCQFLLIVTLYIIGGLSKKYADNDASGVTSSNALIYGNVACMFLFQGFYSYVSIGDKNQRLTSSRLVYTPILNL